VLVVVDVLSFTTCVEVATSSGVEIIPCVFKDERAAETARRNGAELVGPRGQARFSLSPASFSNSRPGTRVVLPSPNGAETTLAIGRVPVVAGCLRNARAVAQHVATLGGRVALVPAGERWPDGSLRPCLEDWLGAGAVLAFLHGRPTPEALAARAAFDSHQRDIEAALLACESGRELVERGYADDVRMAAQLDVSDCVPVFSGHSFARAAVRGR
jgi:2-phosphosulfolactate phosphatase